MSSFPYVRTVIKKEGVGTSDAHEPLFGQALI